MLIAALGGGRWCLWRFFPGGRALWAQMQAFSRDFTAVMARIAAGLPEPAALPPAPMRAPVDRPAATPRETFVRAPATRQRRRRVADAPVDTAQAARDVLPLPPRDQPF